MHFTVDDGSTRQSLQAELLKEVPNRMLVATARCVFSAVQSFVVAVVAERDLCRWRLHLDASLLSVVYAVSLYGQWSVGTHLFELQYTI
jgi:hypothetical protein